MIREDVDQVRQDLERRIFEYLQETGDKQGYGREYYPDYREIDLDSSTIVKLLDDWPEKFDEMMWEWQADLNVPEAYEDLIEKVKWEFELDDEFDNWDITRLCNEAGFYVFVDPKPLLENRLEVTITVKDLDVMQTREWDVSSGGKLIDVGDETRRVLKALGTSFTQFKRWWNDWSGWQERDLFHRTIAREYHNLGYDYSTLTFLWYPTMTEYVALKEAGKIRVEPGTCCGFVSYYNGGGSTLEIELDRALVFKAGQVDIWPDRDWHYGVQSIYGLVSSVWEGNIEPV